MKVRGRFAVGAGIFIMVLISAVWAFVAYLFATHALDITPAVAADFSGKLYVGFALIFVCGILGVMNGRWMIANGKPNVALTVGALAIFFAALFTLYQANLTMSS